MSIMCRFFRKGAILFIVRDSSAVRRLFVRLAGAEKKPSEGRGISDYSVYCGGA